MTSAAPERSTHRMRGPLAILALCISFSAPLIPTSTARAAAVPPNVVIFLADDQARGTMAAMPNVMSSIAGPGVAFARAYISDPLCCPSRASILTGLYPTHTGVFTNGGGTDNIQYGGTAAFEANGDSDLTVAKTLHDAGYQTALFGKYLNGYRTYSLTHPDANGYFRPPGWDVWRAFYENNGKYYDYDLLRDDAGSTPSLVHHGHGASKALNDYSTTVLGNDVMSWLKHRDTASPFFAYVAPFAPHGPSGTDFRDRRRFKGLAPFVSPAIGESAAAKADMPTYVRAAHLSPAALATMQRNRILQFRALYGFDRQIGRVMTFLNTIDPRTGAPYIQNTIVIYLSDNGVMWGEHDLTGKAVPYERSTHVPMYLRYDGAPAASGYFPRTTNHGLVANIDIAPTIYDFTGVSPPATLDGASLIDGHDDGVLLAELTQGPGSAPSYCGVVTADGWKYVVYVPQPDSIEAPYEEELYRLGDDPYELNNRAPDTSDRAAQRALTRARAMLQRTQGGHHWCQLPGVPSSWYNAWS